MSMRINEALDKPGGRAAHPQAELLLELADQRVPRRFAGFELSPRKLPIACEGLAGRTLGKEYATVRTRDDRRGDRNDAVRHARRNCVFSAAAPA
jgi:hypothetical protein